MLKGKGMKKGLGLILGASVLLGACGNGGDDVATIKGDAYTEKELVNDLHENGVLTKDVLAQFITKEAILKYYKPTKEEYDKKVEEYKKEFKKNKSEFTAELEKQNKEKIELGLASEKAFEDLANVKDEDIKKFYEENKTEYKVFDVMVLDKSKVKLDKLKSDLKEVKDEKGLDKLKKKYGQSINAVVMSYKSGQLPEGFDKKEFKKDAILDNNKKDATNYNVMKVSEVKELKLDDNYKKQIKDTLKLKEIQSVDALMKKLKEKHKDFKISDEMNKILEEKDVNTMPQGMQQQAPQQQGQ